MDLKLKNFANQECGDIHFDDALFSVEPREDIIYRVIHWQLAKRRAGTHQVKERGDVAGSTRKIRAQKGSGGARHGGIRAAQFRGGGIIFGPHYRSHEYKLNKKIRKMGLHHVLSFKMQAEKMLIIDSMNLDTNKTKDLLSKLSNFTGKSFLLVDFVDNVNLKQASSNIHNALFLPIEGMNVYDLVKYDILLISKRAAEQISERLA